MMNFYSEADREWGEIFDTHFNHLVLYVNHYINSASVSEDIVQDMFVSLWQKRGRNTITPSFLYVCARNAAFTYIRLHPQKFISDSDIDLGRLKDTDSMDEEMEYAKKLEEVREAIKNLSPQCREVLKKIYYENKKYAEVAQEMDLSLNTVKTHIYIAIKVLRSNFLFFLLFVNGH